MGYDKVSTTVPVTIIHLSGHFSAVNSVGLQKIGYTAATKDPAAGSSAVVPGARSRTA
jgi:predicted amidohydrolase YtcJ